MSNGWSRKRQTPATKQRARDYASAEHQQIRKRRVAAATPHTPCSCGCGQPLGPDSSTWHVPHDPQRNYLPGLWRADCNRREAARRGARIRNARATAKRSTPAVFVRRPR